MDNGASSYRRFLDGDESAFDEIMNEIFDNLVFFINGYVNDFYAAEDIAINTFSDLIVHRGRYNFKVKLKTYLFMIGRCRALNYIKHRRTHAETELSEELFVEDESSIFEAVLKDERRRRIYSALEVLPSDMRTAVYLVYFEDMTYDDAAKVMKKNKKQVDNLLYRAKKELTVILGKDGEHLI